MVGLQEAFPITEIKGINKQQLKIVNCRISRNKLIARLNDDREVSIPVSLLTEWSVLAKNVKPEQLKRNEIRGEGNLIYFPEIDEALPSWKVIQGLHTC